MFNSRRDRQLNQIIRNEEIIMATLDDVIASVADEDTTIDAAVIAINGLQAQVETLKTPTTDAATAKKIDALKADIDAKKAKLAAAIVVNTPVVPPVVASTPIVTQADANTAADASVKANAPVDQPKV